MPTRLSPSRIAEDLELHDVLTPVLLEYLRTHRASSRIGIESVVLAAVRRDGKWLLLRTERTTGEANARWQTLYFRCTDQDVSWDNRYCAERSLLDHRPSADDIDLLLEAPDSPLQDPSMLIDDWSFNLEAYATFAAEGPSALVRQRIEWLKSYTPSWSWSCGLQDG